MNYVVSASQLSREWAIAKKDIRIYYLKGPVLIFGIFIPSFYSSLITSGELQERYVSRS